jgi:hypothetical protein
MAFDFPNAPTLNQIATAPNGSYRWDGTKWVTTGTGGFLALSGGTVTGAVTFGSTVTLAADPTLALQAATKQYVDRGVRQVFGTIALLRANALTALTLVYVEGYAAVGGPGGGAFQYVPTDTTSADNGGTIIVDAAGQRWYRETEGAATNVQWFGATGNGATNDTSAIQAALNTSLAVHFSALPSGAQAVYLVTTALTMRAGHRLFGDGIGVSVLKANTASQTVLSFISPSYIMGRLYISDLSIQANAAGVTGIAVTLANNLTFSNIEFMGCEGDNIRQDRGYFTLMENCEALPNQAAGRKAGRFYFNSTDVADYCFYPTLQNCRTHTGEEVGISVGVVSTACIHFRRVISGVINNFVGERLNLPAANTVDGIWVENDSQGIQIINGVTYGAKNGIILFPGTGPAVAPGYLTVADHAIDAFSVAGVSIGGTPAAVCVDVTVQDCLLTAPQGSATAIVCQDVLRVVVNGNSIDQYQAQGGAGILLSTVIGAQVVGNIMNNLATGIGLAGATNLNMVIADNVFENCANNLIGDITAGGSGTNRVRDNVGLAVGIVATPAVPASGGTLINISGYDVMVYVSGGTNLNWIVNGFVVGPSTGPFLVAAGGNIAVSYTTPPTWVWGGI